MNREFTDIDLKNAWKDLSQKRFENKVLEKNEIMEAIKSKSSLNITSLKKNLKLKADMCFVFVFIFVAIALLNFNYDVKANINADAYFHLLLACIYAIGTFFLYRRYNKMDDKLATDISLLENLKNNRDYIKSALVIERLWGILVFILIGAFYFYQWNSEDSSPRAFINQMGFFILALVILIPIAEYMNKKKFGIKIKELEEDIIRLELLQ